MRLAQVHLENILSFRDAELRDLGPVNLFIGPNGSGKSNFLDALGLLPAAPKTLGDPIAQGGGIREWIWRGQPSRASVATIACDLKIEESKSVLYYSLSLKELTDGAFTIDEERLVPQSDRGQLMAPVFFRQKSTVMFPRLLRSNRARTSQISPSESVFVAYRDPTKRRELTAVGRSFERIRIYRNFDTSTEPNAKAGARRGISASYLPVNELDEDGYNLPLILNRMRINDSIRRVEAYLQEFNQQFKEVHVDVTGGTARIYIKEQGLQRLTPGARLSDGTLKFLCLLAALFNSESDTSLVCIDEPETGLHPDAVRLLARAISDAAAKVQLIIVTHSEALVDEFSDTPEAVVVCESDAKNGTQFKRLSRKKLKTWLKDYSLGELWRKGTIGGKPW